MSEGQCSSATGSNKREAGVWLTGWLTGWLTLYGVSPTQADLNQHATRHAWQHSLKLGKRCVVQPAASEAPL